MSDQITKQDLLDLKRDLQQSLTNMATKDDVAASAKAVVAEVNARTDAVVAASAQAVISEVNARTDTVVAASAKAIIGEVNARMDEVVAASAKAIITEINERTDTLVGESGIVIMEAMQAEFEEWLKPFETSTEHLIQGLRLSHYTVDGKVDNAEARLNDHEGRLRRLEANGA